MIQKQEGEQGDSIEGYKLPVCDTQEERRNFKGAEKKVYYSLEDLRLGDWAGSTDTDSGTDDRQDLKQFGDGYSKIQKKRTEAHGSK